MESQVVKFRVPYRPGPMPFVLLAACAAATTVVQSDRSMHTLTVACALLVVGLAFASVFDGAKLTLGPSGLRFAPPRLQRVKELARRDLRGARVERARDSGGARVTVDHRDGPVTLIELTDEALARDLVNRIERWLGPESRS
ncbi:MAG: hypothetical protein ABMA64_29595 [Myxococcota bacterium]